jgi:hypothetical protein
MMGFQGARVLARDHVRRAAKEKPSVSWRVMTKA